jgi:hypothetical protein
VVASLPQHVGTDQIEHRHGIVGVVSGLINSHWNAVLLQQWIGLAIKIIRTVIKGDGNAASWEIASLQALKSLS